MTHILVLVQSPPGVLWLNNDFPVVPSLVPWALKSHRVRTGGV